MSVFRRTNTTVSNRKGTGDGGVWEQWVFAEMQSCLVFEEQHALLIFSI